MTKAALIAVLLFAASMTGYAAESGKEDAKGIVCEQGYALCTSAPCIPDPRDPDKKAICSCESTEGKSFGMKECSQRKPSTDANGVTMVTSSYSFAQAPTNPILVCPAGQPWTNCLDSPCIVDPMDPLHAICTCDIVRTDAFVTYGGACNTLTCDTAYWSGATFSMIDSGTSVLLKEMGIEKSPLTYCPGMEPK
jgi:hypothetical protein